MTSMKIGILGSGAVGQALAARLQGLGHSVAIGTRDPAATLARTENDYLGNPPFKVWHEKNKAVTLGTFAQAAAHGALVINATSGMGSLAALRSAGEANLANKVLLDVSNPLDFSKGMPPTMSVCDSDSVAEQIQRAFPSAKVVKSLNTMTVSVIVNPEGLHGGDHTVFLSGNDAGAKQTVATMLKSFGWREPMDLGDITTARGTEMFIQLWFRIYAAGQSPMFAIKVVR